MSIPNVDAPQDTPTPAAPAARAVDAVTPKSNATPTEPDPASKPGYVSALPENVVVDPNNQPEPADKDAVK
jgi:hypothetical protein